MSSHLPSCFHHVNFHTGISYAEVPCCFEAQLTVECVGHTSSNSIDMDAKGFGRRMVVVGGR